MIKITLTDCNRRENSYNEKEKNNINEFVSTKFGVSFSLDHDVYKYKVAKQKKDGSYYIQEEMYDCIRIGEGFYHLLVSNAEFQIMPILVILIENVNGSKHPVAITSENSMTHELLWIDFGEEWTAFRRNEQINQSQEINNI